MPVAMLSMVAEVGAVVNLLALLGTAEAQYMEPVVEAAAGHPGPEPLELFVLAEPVVRVLHIQPAVVERADKLLGQMVVLEQPAALVICAEPGVGVVGLTLARELAGPEETGVMLEVEAAVGVGQQPGLEDWGAQGLLAWSR